MPSFKFPQVEYLLFFQSSGRLVLVCIWHNNKILVYTFYCQSYWFTFCTVTLSVSCNMHFLLILLHRPLVNFFFFISRDGWFRIAGRMTGSLVYLAHIGHFRGHFSLWQAMQHSLLFTYPMTQNPHLFNQCIPDNIRFLSTICKESAGKA
jgi:hypothetical protein